MFAPLPTGPYDILYADAPWDYAGGRQHGGKGKKDTGGALVHYPTVTTKDLKSLPLRDIVAPDSLLFLWVTSPHLDQGIDLMKAWGWAYKTVAFVWDKEITNPGSYTLSQVELCLVGKRGRIPRPRGARNVRQLVRELRRAHSQKPDDVAARIHAMFPTQRKLELFARVAQPHFDRWGLDAPLDTNT